MPTTQNQTPQTPPAVKGHWTPQKQIDLEKTLTQDQATASRDALNAEQKKVLEKYLELIKAHPELEGKIVLVSAADARAKAAADKLLEKTKAEQDALAKKEQELKDKTEAEKEAESKTYQTKLQDIDSKIAKAPPNEQPALYLEKEQLKEWHSLNALDLDQKNLDELNALREQANANQSQLDSEYQSDLLELAQQRPQDLARLDIEANGWTPEKQLAVEEGMSFAEFGDERKKLTEDQIFAIEAHTQGLEEEEWTPEQQLKKEEGMSFEQWGEERKKLTGEQIEDIEAFTQGLEPTSKEGQLEAERQADLKELEQERPEELKKLEEEIKAPAPELLITRTNYPKWWTDAITAPITLGGAGSQTIVPARPGFRIYVASITFLVGDETDITLQFGIFGSTGSMPFGGSDEPRGITINMGDSPAPCGQGPFRITSGGASATVGGFAVYYLEKEKQ